MLVSDIQSKYIFLSYGHDEFAAFAERLKRDLEADGYHVWFDVDRLTEGQDWENGVTSGMWWASWPVAGTSVVFPTGGPFHIILVAHAPSRFAAPEPAPGTTTCTSTRRSG